ncbi:hypothetical protein C2E23DRAFT_892486, partial [Lenzites betulinus]
MKTTVANIRAVLLLGRARPFVVLPLMATAYSSSAELGKGVLLNNYMAAASITILYFDYSLTVGTEIDRFWGKARLSAASTLFVLNRYLGLLGIVPVMLEYFGHFPPQRLASSRPCAAVSGPNFGADVDNFRAIINITLSPCRSSLHVSQPTSSQRPGTVHDRQSVYPAILLVRTMALYEGNKRILWVLVVVCFSVGLLTVLVISKVVNLTPDAATVADTPAGDYMGYCDLSLTVTQGYRSVVGWIAMLCVETTIFGLTLVKAVRMRTSLRHGTIGVLFRDGQHPCIDVIIARVTDQGRREPHSIPGAIYYGVLVLAGVANILTFLAPGINDNDRGIATTLTNVLSTTLTSRMILNLRDPNLHRSRLHMGRWTLTHPTQAGAMALQTVSASADGAR